MLILTDFRPSSGSSMILLLKSDRRVRRDFRLLSIQQLTKALTTLAEVFKTHIPMWTTGNCNFL
ncbi:MAG: hypothetical protein Fur0046_07080 [Cyanobacteria bacterium J069]